MFRVIEAYDSFIEGLDDAGSASNRWMGDVSGRVFINPVRSRRSRAFPRERRHLERSGIAHGRGDAPPRSGRGNRKTSGRLPSRDEKSEGVLLLRFRSHPFGPPCEHYLASLSETLRPPVRRRLLGVPSKARKREKRFPRKASPLRYFPLFF